MSKNKKLQKGFAQILPMLAVVALIAGVVVVASSLNKNKTTVLGDSTTDKVEGTQSGNQNNFGPQLQVQAQVSDQNGNKTPEPTDKPEAGKTMEPKETVEPKQSPEPSETPEAKKLEVQTESENGKVKVQIESANGSFQYQKDGNHFQVETDFPLSVDASTSALTVTTPAGSKTVAVLPDEALKNLLSQGIISTQSGIVLSQGSNGEMVYEVKGSEDKKLLGVFNVSIDKTAQVSSANGQVLSVNQSFLSKLLDLLSF